MISGGVVSGGVELSDPAILVLSASKCKCLEVVQCKIKAKPGAAEFDPVTSLVQVEVVVRSVSHPVSYSMCMYDATNREERAIKDRALELETKRYISRVPESSKKRMSGQVRSGMHA